MEESSLEERVALKIPTAAPVSKAYKAMAKDVEFPSDAETRSERTSAHSETTDVDDQIACGGERPIPWPAATLHLNQYQTRLSQLIRQDRCGADVPYWPG